LRSQRAVFCICTLACILEVADDLARLGDQSLEVVDGLDLLGALIILAAVLLRLGDHALNLSLRRAARALDLDVSLGASGLVLGRHGQHSVGVERERNVDLGHTALGLLDSADGELAQQVVLVSARALTLVHAHIDLGLKGKKGKKHTQRNKTRGKRRK